MLSTLSNEATVSLPRLTPMERAKAIPSGGWTIVAAVPENVGLLRTNRMWMDLANETYVELTVDIIG